MFATEKVFEKYISVQTTQPPIAEDKEMEIVVSREASSEEK